MKTYLLDILNRYNRFSEKLDVKTILCNKAWLIFNDEGKKEVYIFQEDGSLIASVNGNVTYANWQYILANKSIIISYNKEQRFMLHPAFIDNTIFALQQNGTNRFVFMIEEKQSQYFNPKSLNELYAYFADIRRKEIKAKERERQRLIEQQREAEKERIERELLNKAKDIKWSRGFQTVYMFTLTFIAILLCSILVPIYINRSYVIFIFFTAIFFVSILGYILLYPIGKWRAKKWKKKHPNDPVNDYL